MAKDTEKASNSGNEKRPLPAKVIRSRVGRVLVVLLILYLAYVGLGYWKQTQNEIYIDNSEISAPLISLGPQVPGVLNHVYVYEGQSIDKNMIVARVNDQNVYSEVAGDVVYVQDVPGEVVSSASGIVEMIQPQDMRVVGRLEENKGLSDIKPGQKVRFTVDAYGSEKFEGVVERVSPAPVQSALAFSISNSRQEKSYYVYVKYDIAKYPEFLYGMSAKMWIEKN